MDAQRRGALRKRKAVGLPRLAHLVALLDEQRQHSPAVACGPNSAALDEAEATLRQLCSRHGSPQCEGAAYRTCRPPSYGRQRACQWRSGSTIMADVEAVFPSFAGSKWQQ